MAKAELRQAGVLDLVDDRRDPLLEQPLVERAGRVDLELGDDSEAGRRRRAARPARAARPRGRGSARSARAGRARAAAAAPGRAPSAPASPARTRARGPARSGSSRFGSLRSSGSMPGGNVNDGSGLQLAPGKFRFRSTPAAFWRVPLRRPSGFATWTTAHAVSSPGIRSSRRRASRPVSASSPCWVAIRSPATGAPDAGSCTRSGRPPRERPYSSSRQPRRTFEVTVSATASAYGQGVRRRSVADPRASASTMQPATMPTSSHTSASVSPLAVTCSSASYA